MSLKYFITEEEIIEITKTLKLRPHIAKDHIFIAPETTVMSMYVVDQDEYESVQDRFSIEEKKILHGYAITCSDYEMELIVRFFKNFYFKPKKILLTIFLTQYMSYIRYIVIEIKKDNKVWVSNFNYRDHRNIFKEFFDGIEEVEQHNLRKTNENRTKVQNKTHNSDGNTACGFN